jgi:RimJ/RimL family protein N-acetyltransferase
VTQKSPTGASAKRKKKGDRLTGSPFSVLEVDKMTMIERQAVLAQRRAAQRDPEGADLERAAQRYSAGRARERLPHRIETRRLVLRAPIRGDVPALVMLGNNPNVAKMLRRLPSPYTRADAIAFVEIFAQRADERPYAITLDGAFIGVVGFTFHADAPPELGYWLGEPHWGKGLMTEAVAGLLEAARNTGAFPEVQATARAENAASLRVLEKAGFRVLKIKAESRKKDAIKIAYLSRELVR